VQPTRSHDRVVDLLYCEHGPALLLFAMGITGERSRAQDAVQQVFLKLLERGDLGHAVDIKAYLFACVRNAALNDSKIRRRHVALRGARRELEVIILLSPGLTEGTSSWGKLADIPAGPHPLNGHPLKFPGVSFSLHGGSFPGNCAQFCVSVQGFTPVERLPQTDSDTWNLAG